jgi:purine-binding chemotaxis protein CheW
MSTRNASLVQSPLASASGGFGTDAQKGAKHDPKSSVSQYLSFMVSGLNLAVPLERVSEILSYEGVSAVPGTPAFVRGVVHVRGRVIPVIDLAVKLGRQPDAVGKRTCILMLDLEYAGEHLELGVVMDGVASLLDVDRQQIAPPPRFGAGVEVKYLQGLLPTEQGMLPLVDIARVFASEELVEVAAAASGACP